MNEWISNLEISKLTGFVDGTSNKQALEYLKTQFIQVRTIAITTAECVSFTEKIEEWHGTFDLLALHMRNRHEERRVRILSSLWYRHTEKPSDLWGAINEIVANNALLSLIWMCLLYIGTIIKLIIKRWHRMDQLMSRSGRNLIGMALNITIITRIRIDSIAAVCQSSETSRYFNILHCWMSSSSSLESVFRFKSDNYQCKCFENWENHSSMRPEQFEFIIIIYPGIVNIARSTTLDAIDGE